MKMKHPFDQLWEEFSAVAGDATLRDWPELKEFCFHVYECGAADEAARIVRQFKSLRGKYDKYQWGLTALNVADEMIAVVRTKPKEPQ
jgi:hypothetical protein